MNRFYTYAFCTIFALNLMPTTAEGFDDSDDLEVLGIGDVEKKIRQDYEDRLLEEVAQEQLNRSKSSANLPEYNPPTGDSVADLIARVGYLEEQSRKQNGKISSLEYELKNVRKEAKAAQTANEKSLERASSQYVTRPGDVNSEYVIKVDGAEQGAPEEDLEELDFNAAVAQVSQQNLAGAKDKFRNFIVVYPESEMLDEAYFWLGELSVEEEDYKSAALNYLKSYKADKEGKRAEEALLKSSSALGKLGKKEEACRNLVTLKNMEGLQELLKEQANSEAIKLGCS